MLSLKNSNTTLVLMLLSSSIAFAQLTSLDEIHFIGDITNTLPTSGGDIYSHDDTIVVLDITTNPNLVTSSNSPLNTLDHAQIDGYHKTDADCTTTTIYSIDITTVIGGVAIRPADVFSFDGTNSVKVLDSVNAGVPDGINVNAISRDPNNCDLILSIDSTSELNGIAFRPGDLVRYEGGATFSLYQATGFNANVDALHILSANRILVSFDAGLSLPDSSSKKEEIFEIYTISNPYQVLAFDTASLDQSWGATNLNALWALPSPIIDLMFSDGFEN